MAAMKRYVERGSSPRMRGAPLASGIVAMKARIIPAHAGSTSALSVRRINSKDHPRVCGEHAAGGGRFT